MRAWIGLGGNQEESNGLFDTALASLATAPGICLLRQSNRYRSAPWGLTDQPDFTNAVAELETELSPLQLLRKLLDIERQLGRQRTGPRWGPRCIDLDLLTYEELTLQSDELELPHPQMHLRAFVLLPLLELDARFVIPGKGPALDCLERIDPSETAVVEKLPRSER